MIKTLIVEDIALARAALQRLLAAHGDIAVTGIAANVGEARRMIARQSFDLALLDVRLPDGSGIDLARSWPGARPHVVFITATPDHAVDAFALEAEDYLLKPITAAGVCRALNRVRKRRGESKEHASTLDAIEIRDGARTVWLDPQMIDYIDTAGHYLCLHVGHVVHLLRSPMADLLDRLGSGFVRIHRSAAVRINAVQTLVARTNGDADVTLASGANLRMSRSYRPQFDQQMKAGSARR